MNWQAQWVQSVSWIAIAYGCSIVLGALALALVVKLTRWGAQFWRIAWPYYDPRRSAGPLLMLAALLFMSIVGVRFSVLYTYWSKTMYDSLQAMSASGFAASMWIFAVIATLSVARSLLNYYMGQAFDIRWRVWLNDHLTDDWLRDQAYYRTRFVDEPVDNPDQRIQLDVSGFVQSSRALGLGVISSMLALVEFTSMLWTLSGPVPVGPVEIPRALVLAVYAYVFIVTLMAFRLGKPLIRLNFLNEKLAADYRYALIRVREYAENIAFYRGEATERRGLAAHFQRLMGNVWAIVYRSLKFDGFNFIADQTAMILPYIIQAPRYFSGAIKLGDMMQTGQAFSQVQSSLSFFRLAYDGFASYRATLDRLSGFIDANDASRALPRPARTEQAAGLRIARLTVRRPNGRPLLEGLDVDLQPGQSLLIQAPSGAGKTTLLRALADLWPHTQGSVHQAPMSRAMFLPQRSYLPQGTLGAALAYPAEELDAAVAARVLERVQLGHLAPHLAEEADWSARLSLGEQQRLAFARVLIHRPAILFLDEATSALDEGLEHAMYATVVQALPRCTLVSVAHRSSVAAFHTHRLHWRPEAPGEWRVVPVAGVDSGTQMPVMPA